MAFCHVGEPLRVLPQHKVEIYVLNTSMCLQLGLPIIPKHVLLCYSYPVPVIGDVCVQSSQMYKHPGYQATRKIAVWSYWKIMMNHEVLGYPIISPSMETNPYTGLTFTSCDDCRICLVHFFQCLRSLPEGLKWWPRHSIRLLQPQFWWVFLAVFKTI